MFDNAGNRKDQKVDAAGDFDDEPEVLEPVEVCLVVLFLMRPVSYAFIGPVTNLSRAQRILLINHTKTEWRSVIMSWSD